MKRFLIALLLTLVPGAALADDMMDPIGPNDMGFFELQEIEIIGDRAYIFLVMGMVVMDISDPAAPAIIGRYPPIPTRRRFFRGTVDGDWVFGGCRYELLRIIDISDEANPTLAALHGAPGMSYEGSALAGDLLYAARHADGLEVIDVADPSQPVTVAELSGLVNCWDIALAGGYGFVADGTGGLAVLDLSNPISPDHLYSLPTPTTAMDIELTGDLALLACGSSGVEVFDISDPLNARWIGNYNSSGLATHLDTVGDRLYIADWDDLEVVDLSVPESPSRIGWERTPVRVMGVAAEADRVWIADWAKFRTYEFGPTPGGDIDLRLRGIDFGAIPVGATADTTFTIWNTGGGDLHVADVLSFNPNFVVQPPTQFTILASGSHDVGLEFHHAAPGYDATFIRIDSDDADEAEISFAVAADDDPQYLNIGEQAPDFTLIDMEGVTHSLSDYLGQVVVFAFFANW